MKEIRFFKKKGIGKRKNTQPYPVELKLEIIKLYQSGEETFRSLSKKYNINQSLIGYWVRKFEGRLINNRPDLILNKFKSMSTEKKEDDNQKIKALQNALEDALLKNRALETMIDIAEEQLKINIRKKPGTKRS